MLRIRMDVHCFLARILNKGCCQTNANQPPLGQHGCPLSRAKSAPLSESGGAVELEIAA